MSTNADYVMSLLREKPMTLNELAMRAFHDKCTIADRDKLTQFEKRMWGVKYISRGLDTLRNFKYVYSVKVKSDNPQFKGYVNEWHIVE